MNGMKKQLVLGHLTLCGCPVTQIDENSFTITHRAACYIKSKIERVEALNGQAVCGGADGPAVLRPDLPWPHEMPEFNKEQQ